MSSDAEASPAPSTPSKPKPSNTRTFILLGILGLAVAALGYDYAVARPAVESAHQKVNDEASKRSQSDQAQLSNVEVAEMFGKSPAEKLQGEHYLVERYSWRGGLPWRTYDCWIVYAPSSDGTTNAFRFNGAYLNEKPEAQFMPGFKGPGGKVGALPTDPIGVTMGGGGGGEPGEGGGGTETNGQEKPPQEPNKKPAEEPAKKPAEEPAEKPAEEPAKKPAEEPAEKPAEEPAKKPAEEPAEKPAEEPAKKPAEEPAEKPAEEPAKKPAEEPAEKPAEEPAKKPEEKPAEKPAEDN